MKTLARVCCVAGLTGLLGVQAFAKLPVVGPLSDAQLQEAVRKALLTVPYVTIFDDLKFQVQNGTVTLLGEVTRPVVKDDAEYAVKNIEGVGAVNDQIEVLPLSPFDDRIRMDTFRALSRDPSTSKYFQGAHPPIHIVVKNGNVTLDGVVMNAMDREIAYLRANGVSGVFSVTNDLRTER